MLILLIVGGAFVECSTLSNTKPASKNSDGGADLPLTPCDIACATPTKLKCNFASECPSLCRLLNDPDFVSCVTSATSCLIADSCNTPK